MKRCSIVEDIQRMIRLLAESSHAVRRISETTEFAYAIDVHRPSGRIAALGAGTDYPSYQPPQSR